MAMGVLSPLSSPDLKARAVTEYDPSDLVDGVRDHKPPGVAETVPSRIPLKNTLMVTPGSAVPMTTGWPLRVFRDADVIVGSDSDNVDITWGGEASPWIPSPLQNVTR